MEWFYVLQAGLNHLLWGFSLSMLVLWIIKVVSKDFAADILKTYLQSCMQLVGILGLAFFLLWLTDQVYIAFIGGQQHAEQLAFFYLSNPTYWPWTLIPAIGPASILLISQSFWWPHNRYKSWLRMLLAILVPFWLLRESYLILLTSLHRDFLMSSWSMLFPRGLLEFTLIGLASFLLAVWVYHKLKNVLASW